MMRRFGRFLLAMLLVTLPLRGVASVLVPLCGPQGAPAAVAHDGCAEHGAESAGSDGQPPAPSAHCSHCVACSGVAPMPSPTLEFASHSPVAAIPFRDRAAQGFVPDLLDRPPLSA